MAGRYISMPESTLSPHIKGLLDFCNHYNGTYRLDPIHSSDILSLSLKDKKFLMQKVLSQVVQEYERAVIFRLVLHSKFKNYETKLTRVNVIELFSFITDYVARVFKGIVQREWSISTDGCFWKDPVPRPPSKISLISSAEKNTEIRGHSFKNSYVLAYTFLHCPPTSIVLHCLTMQTTGRDIYFIMAPFLCWKNIKRWLYLKMCAKILLRFILGKNRNS